MPSPSKPKRFLHFSGAIVALVTALTLLSACQSNNPEASARATETTVTERSDSTADRELQPSLPFSVDGTFQAPNLTLQVPTGGNWARVVVPNSTNVLLMERTGDPLRTATATVLFHPPPAQLGSREEDFVAFARDYLARVARASGGEVLEERLEPSTRFGSFAVHYQRAVRETMIREDGPIPTLLRGEGYLYIDPALGGALVDLAYHERIPVDAMPSEYVPLREGGRHFLNTATWTGIVSPTLPTLPVED